MPKASLVEMVKVEWRNRTEYMDRAEADELRVALGRALHWRDEGANDCLFILRRVCELENVTEQAVKSPCKKQRLAWIRHRVCWLCRELTSHSLEDVTKTTGRTHHTSTHYSVKAVSARMDTEPMYREETNRIKELLAKELENGKSTANHNQGG